nr:hypothetical protein [Tanacetum cinerariifolium]
MMVPNVPNSTIKLMLFPFSLEGAARIWLKNEPPRSILTWDDLVSKFINQFFLPSKTTNLRNKITRFQQRFDESFSEAWDRFNDLLRACPHHGFSELHQLDTFYNAFNVNDQDSLNSVAGGNFLDKMPSDCLKIIESKSKVRQSRAKAVVTKVNSSSSTPAISSDVAELKDMVRALLLDKKNQSSAPAPAPSPTPAPVKAIESNCVIYGGTHSYQNCPATNGNVYQDNIQEYVSQAAAANYNQGNTGFCPQMVANQIRPPGFPPVQNNQNNFNRGNNFTQNRGADDQPIIESSQHPEWFSQQKKPPTPDRDWNKTLPANHGSIQPWISDLAKQIDSRSTFNELMDTPMDFSAFLMNRLRSSNSFWKKFTRQLDWVNPEGQQYPYILLKPLPLILNSRGRRVIPFDQFINNDFEYLRGGASSRKYTTSITKTKAAYYGHIKWIEDLVPRTMWIQEPVGYDKHALWGISYWGLKRQQLYDFAVNRESAHDVYSKRRIIIVTELKIVEWHNYKHLDWITVRRDDDKLYKFKEGDFKRLHIQDIEDMLLLLVQGKLTNLTVEERFAINKKLKLTRPDTYRFDLKCKEAYIAYSNPRGFIYQNKDKQNKLTQIDELHKFSDGTLTDVHTALDNLLKGTWMKYLPQSI